MDGTTGEVFVGKLGMTTPDLSEQKEHDPFGLGR